MTTGKKGADPPSKDALELKKQTLKDLTESGEEVKGGKVTITLTNPMTIPTRPGTIKPSAMCTEK